MTVQGSKAAEFKAPRTLGSRFKAAELLVQGAAKLLVQGAKDAGFKVPEALVQSSRFKVQRSC